MNFAHILKISLEKENQKGIYISTISAVRDRSSQFDGSATPDLALIDSEYRDVVWIDAKHPSQWDKLCTINFLRPGKKVNTLIIIAYNSYLQKK